MASELPPPRALPWHQPLWEQVRARRGQGTLPHALLLTGPHGVGKQQFAARLAMALVCESPQLEKQPCGQCKGCTLAQSGTHPDIHWLRPEEPGKAIRIDAVRELIGRSTLTTQAVGSRVFLISPADAMNRASANALLKTLEEPTASSTLILISSDPHRLPATIRSRCQTLVFKPVDAQQAGEWLEGQVEGAHKQALLAFSGGAPLLALEAAEQQRLQGIAQLLGQLLELKSRRVNPMQIVEAWLARPLDGLLDDLSRACSDLVQVCAGVQGSRLFNPGSAAQLQSLAEDIHLAELFRFIDRFNELRRLMTHNLNPQMLLEKIVTDWLALTRPGVR